MDRRVQLLNVAVDIAATKTASDATISYLEEESSKVVYFLNSETLLLLEQNSTWRETVEASELVLPGTASVNRSIDQVLGHRRDSFFLESYFDAMWDYVVENGLELLIVAANESRFVSIQEHIHEKRPFLTLSGFFVTEQKESTDHIVNEINSVAPDILLVALEEKEQLELLMNYRNQMNARLILFSGNILYNKAVSEAEVPEQIQKLRIGNLYKWYRKSGRVKNFFNNIRMKFKLKQHRKDQEP
ncbi:MAG: WecB/TagA/CpsF family glycosyltransferase [Lachnospiraceae bacterium]|nr:WecB/TagA/CpsF family glycosyltransferase [Lachnospiraceae bacterium]